MAGAALAVRVGLITFHQSWKRRYLPLDSRIGNPHCCIRWRATETLVMRRKSMSLVSDSQELFLLVSCANELTDRVPGVSDVAYLENFGAGDLETAVARLRLHGLQFGAQDLHLGHQVALVARQRLFVFLVGQRRDAQRGRRRGRRRHRRRWRGAGAAVDRRLGRRRRRRRRHRSRRRRRRRRRRAARRRGRRRRRRRTDAGARRRRWWSGRRNAANTKTVHRLEDIHFHLVFFFDTKKLSKS